MMRERVRLARQGSQFDFARQSVSTLSPFHQVKGIAEDCVAPDTNKCVSKLNVLDPSDPIRFCQELQPTQSGCVNDGVKNPPRKANGVCPSDGGSEWCCPGSYCKGFPLESMGVWCESCMKCSIEPKNLYDESMCPPSRVLD